MRATQNSLILEHLKKHKAGGLSQAEALGLYCVWRLASRVSELRGLGFDFRVSKHVDRNGHRYSRYYLKG